MNNYYGYLGTNNHNTDSDFSYQTTKKIQEARILLAKLINAKTNEVIFTSGATESLSMFAHGLSSFLKNDENIIMTLAEHSSDILP
jgi:cysteine desulfurase/selenocysteine lyase